MDCRIYNSSIAKEEFIVLLEETVQLSNTRFIKDFVDGFNEEEVMFIMIDNDKALQRMFTVIDLFQIINLANISLAKICEELNIKDYIYNVKRFTRLRVVIKGLSNILELMKKYTDNKQEIKNINNRIIDKFIQYMDIDEDIVKAHHDLLYL